MAKLVNAAALKAAGLNDLAGSSPATPTNLAWAAGLFEGEGSIYKTTVNNKYTYIRLNVTSTDLDVLEKFQSILGVGKIYKKSRPKNSPSHWKDCWHWQLQESNQRLDKVGYVIRSFEPWLCKRRLAKAKELKIIP